MPAPVPRVPPPMYNSRTGDPFASYSGATTPRPPTTARARSPPRGLAAGTATATASTARPPTTNGGKKVRGVRERGWVVDAQSSPIFSTYARERSLLLSGAIADAVNAKNPRDRASTPRTRLILSHVAFCIGDGGNGCLTAAGSGDAPAAAGAALCSLPTVTPRESQHLTTQNSPTRAATTARPRPLTAATDGVPPAPVLFAFGVPDGESYFTVAAVPPKPVQVLSRTSSPIGRSRSPPHVSAGSDGTAATTAATEPPQALFWTVVKVPRADQRLPEQQRTDAKAAEGATASTEPSTRSDNKPTPAERSTRSEKTASGAAHDPDLENTQRDTVTSAPHAPPRWTVAATSAPGITAGEPFVLAVTAEGGKLRALHLSESGAAVEAGVSAAELPKDFTTETLAQTFFLRAEPGADASAWRIATTQGCNLVAVPADNEYDAPLLRVLKLDSLDAATDRRQAEWRVLSAGGSQSAASVALESLAFPRHYVAVHPESGAARLIEHDDEPSDLDAARSRFAVLRVVQEGRDAETKNSNDASTAAAAHNNQDSTAANKAPKKLRKKVKKLPTDCDVNVILAPAGAYTDAGEPAEAASAEANAATTDAAAQPKPQAPAPAFPSAAQLWGLHPMTATTADGSRLYFFTCKAYPGAYLAINDVSGTAELRVRPAGDASIAGNVLVRSRQDVVESVEYHPPKTATRVPQPPRSELTSLRRGQTLAAGSHIASCNGQFRLSVLHSGSIVVETAAAGRQRNEEVRKRMKQGLVVATPQPPSRDVKSPKSGGGSARHKTQQQTSPRGGPRSAPAGAEADAAKTVPPAVAAEQHVLQAGSGHKPLWQSDATPPRQATEYCSGLRLLTNGSLVLFGGNVSGGDATKRPAQAERRLWCLEAVRGSLLRVTDDGVLELLEHHVILERQRLREPSRSRRRDRRQQGDRHADEHSQDDSDDGYSSSGFADEDDAEDLPPDAPETDFVVVWAANPPSSETEPAPAAEAKKKEQTVATADSVTSAAEPSTTPAAQQQQQQQQQKQEPQSSPGRSDAQGASTSASPPAAQPTTAAADSAPPLGQPAAAPPSFLRLGGDGVTCGGAEPLLASPDDVYVLIAASGGVLRVVQRSTDAEIWATEAEVGAVGPFVLRLTDGDLKVVDKGDDHAVWATSTKGSEATMMRLTNAGTIELVKEDNGAVVWASVHPPREPAKATTTAQPTQDERPATPPKQAEGDKNPEPASPLQDGAASSEPSDAPAAPAVPATAAPAAAATAPATNANHRRSLPVGTALAPGDTLVSPSGEMTLTLHDDGTGSSLTTKSGEVRWTTRGTELAEPPRGLLLQQDDGKLVMVDDFKDAIWTATFDAVAAPAQATQWGVDDNGSVVFFTD
jgi:hypothetical protein